MVRMHRVEIKDRQGNFNSEALDFSYVTEIYASMLH